MIFKEIYYKQMRDSNKDSLNFTNNNNLKNPTKNIKSSSKTLYFNKEFNNFTKFKLIDNNDNKIIPTKNNQLTFENNSCKSFNDTYKESIKDKIFAKKSLFNFRLKDLLKKEIEEISKKEELYISPKRINKLKRDLDFKTTIIEEFLNNLK